MNMQQETKNREGTCAKCGALQVVFEKEFADYFRGPRFLLVLGILLVSAVIGAGGAMETMQQFAEKYSSEYIFLYLFTGENQVLPSVVSSLSFLGPIVGILLGFDAISSERSNGTLSRILSLPIYRDTLINAKALSGICIIFLTTLSIACVVIGLGALGCGVVPMPAEIVRIALFMVFTVVYIFFWMCLAILFSIIFRQPTISVLCGIAVWIFSSIFIPIISEAAASVIAPLSANATEAVFYQNQQIQFLLQKFSPATLYTEAVNIILNPMIRTAGPISAAQMEGMTAGFLSVSQSLLQIWGQFVGLLALAVICFALAYILFSRQEIRA